MATPSKLNDNPIISLTGLFQSTPESAHKNVTPVAVSQLMSLRHSQKTVKLMVKNNIINIIIHLTFFKNKICFGI